MDITALVMVVWLLIARLFTTDEDIRRLEAEEIEENKRWGWNTL